MTTILVVDDEPTLREIVAEMLREERYTVITAPDGQQAVELVKREHVDLVLMDVMMPGLDGREAYLAMRAHPEIPDMPVVMMSAGIAPDRLDPSLAAFLPKPFQLDQLLDLVARLIRARNGDSLHS